MPCLLIHSKKFKNLCFLTKPSDLLVSRFMSRGPKSRLSVFSEQHKAVGFSVLPHNNLKSKKPQHLRLSIYWTIRKLRSFRSVGTHQNPIYLALFSFLNSFKALTLICSFLCWSFHLIIKLRYFS